MARIEGNLSPRTPKRDRLPRFATCVQRRPIADREKRSKSAQRPRWVRIAARMVVESASLIGSQSDLRIVDLHHRERLARSAVVADDGKVSDSDRVMFLRVSHAAPASDLEGWRWPDTSVECPGQPRVDRWLRHPIRADSTSHTPSRSGPRPAFTPRSPWRTGSSFRSRSCGVRPAMSSWIARNTLTSTCARALLGP